MARRQAHLANMAHRHMQPSLQILDLLLCQVDIYIYKCTNLTRVRPLGNYHEDRILLYIVPTLPRQHFHHGWPSGTSHPKFVSTNPASQISGYKFVPRELQKKCIYTTVKVAISLSVAKNSHTLYQEPCNPQSMGTRNCRQIVAKHLTSTAGL